jgi:hypothetical protein
LAFFLLICSISSQIFSFVYSISFIWVYHSNWDLLSNLVFISFFLFCKSLFSSFVLILSESLVSLSNYEVSSYLIACTVFSISSLCNLSFFSIVFRNSSEMLSFFVFNYVSNSMILVRATFKELLTSRTDEAFKYANAWSTEAAFMTFYFGSSPTFHSTNLPIDDLSLAKSPLFLLFNLFSMLLVLSS